MSEWVEKYFRDFIKLNRGFDLPNDQMIDGNYPVVASTGVKGFHNQYKIIPPCVVTGRSGSLGAVQYIEKKCIPLNTTLYVKDYKGNNPKFVFYFLKTMHLEVFNSGAGVPTLNQNHLHGIKLLIPDFPTQTRIASILSAYDNAIENNNRRIMLLEKAARDIYQEWFVRFRFPGYKKARFVNGLPEGWERVKFSGNISYFTGKLDSNEMVDDGQYNFYTCAKTIFKTNSYCYDGECVLLGGNNATGDFSLFYANEKLNAYQRTYIVTPISNRLSCPYIFFVLRNYLQTFKTASTGAATKFLTKKMLDNFYIILPLQKLSDEYKRIAKPLFDEMGKLQSKSQNLARQRDLLLPRLMSGRLEV